MHIFLSYVYKERRNICLIIVKTIFANMQLFFIFSTILFAVSHAVNENDQAALWKLFKRVHKKQYTNVQEEQYR
jgi:hypothetical protein